MNIRALCLSWLLALVGTAAWAADLTVGAYALVSSKRLSRTDFEFVYRAQVSNSGPALRNVLGTVVSTNPATLVLEGTLSFGDVANGATATSIDTFTIRHDRSVPFDAAKLVWTVNGTPASPIQSDFSVSPEGGNAPLTIRFTPTPTTNAAINLFQWDFDGNGSIDVTDTVGRNQTRTYSTPGSYAVSLKITDSQGRTDTRTKTIVVNNAAPVVAASASPTNGQVPLTVNFLASATDSNGVVRYEWDFDGDGTYDRTINSSTGNTSFAFTSVGRFVPKVRVTDGLGASVVVSVPTMEVRAAPVGSAQASLSVSRSSGPAPLTVDFTANAASLLGRTVRSYQWDPDGNGSFDANTDVNRLTHSYPGAGTFYPRVRITLSDGSQADDVKQVSVTSTVQLALSTDTLDAQLAQAVIVNTTLSAATRASLVVETRAGAAVRTVLPLTERAAGSYSDSWDGKDGNGQYVAEGIYKLVLLYELNGALQRLDLSNTTGGVEYNPTRSKIPSSFSPFDNQPLTIDFTLTRASEVTAFMGSFNVDTRYVTFYTRQAFGRGTHRITWNGDNALGQLIKPGPRDAFLFGIWGYTLPNNAVFVRNGVQLSAMLASPPIFDPTGVSAAGQANRCAVQFTLSLPATAELVVQDAVTGAVVARQQYPGLAAGANTVLWDGKASDGRYAAPGTYRLGITAIQGNGFQSLSSYVLQRVYY